MDSPLLTFETPILVVGRKASDYLRVFFQKIGYGGETVTYVESLASAGAEIRANSVSVLMFRVPCGRYRTLIDLARERSELVRVVGLGDPEECGDMPVDSCISWPPTFEEFAESLETQTWLNAVAQTGYRGHVKGQDGS